jgi:hypothetical protein
MFFLLRMAFWLTLVLALLPSGGSQPLPQGPQIAATDAVIAAGAAVSDMSSFCDRQPEACEVGAHAAVVIGQRAQAGARMVYDFINERVARSETGSLPETKVAPDAKITPASFHAPTTVPVHPGSQTTLKPDDLTPAWRGPQPRKEAQPRRDPKRPV